MRRDREPHRETCLLCGGFLALVETHLSDTISELRLRQEWTCQSCGNTDVHMQIRGWGEISGTVEP